MTEARARPATWTDWFFRIALVVKGIDGAAELIGAVGLLLVPGDWLTQVIASILSRDLIGPPDGALARHLTAGTEALANGDRTFPIVYLGLHGIIKLALVWALLARWLPAYPPAMVVLAIFVVYELVHAWHTGSVLLPFLAALDVAIIVLVFREWRELRRQKAG